MVSTSASPLDIICDMASSMPILLVTVYNSRLASGAMSATMCETRVPCGVPVSPQSKSLHAANNAEYETLEDIAESFGSKLSSIIATVTFLPVIPISCSVSACDFETPSLVYDPAVCVTT